MYKLTYIFLIFLAISCSTGKPPKFSTLKRVVISGKVLNFNSDNRIVNISVNRIGFSSKQLESELDSLGNFSASFEGYIPTDVWVSYKTNFLILTHPGDSLHVVFDGKPQMRPDILKTIKFSGDAAEINQKAATFQYLYFSSTLYNDWETKGRAMKDFDLNNYSLYLDTLKLKSKQLYEKFCADNSPNKEIRTWALTFIEEDYYDALAFYPMDHKRANKLKSSDWSVPISYYNSLKYRLPITESMFINGYALNNFVNRFHYGYVRNNIWDEEVNKKYKIETDIGVVFVAPTPIMDSINVYGTIKYTPDTLLRQMVLTEMFRQELEKSKINIFEKYRNVIDDYIQAPFLKEPLLELYYQTKERIENPGKSADIIFKNLRSSSVNQIMDSILLNNKGKVIYLDCWATWCGPCRSEMPNSKKLMKEMTGKEIAFVYMCLDSEEKIWKASLSEFQLDGQHYYLSNKQSSDIRKVFEISGVPYYLLFDKNGTIIEKGSHLRPDVAKVKIDELLNK